MNPSALTKSPDGIALCRELKSFAEAGLRYNEGQYDSERYERLHELASLPLKGAAPGFTWPQEFGYTTPKVAARSAVINESDYTLLVQESSSGEWTDLNVCPAENAVKEVREKSSNDVEVDKLIACWDKDKQDHPHQPERVYKLVFLCRITGESLTTRQEISGSGFFAADELPRLCPHRAATHYLDLAWQHAEDLSLSTTFD
jgi:ADP-ribose pyrophosphatase YjhB (NUDIX family)